MVIKGNIMKLGKDTVKGTRSVLLKKLGFIVNPIAGMGGAVGLKGTDGKSILRKARLLGAIPLAPYRARGFLSHLTPVRPKIQLFVGAGDMGENEARKGGFEYRVLGKRKEETHC